MVVSRQHCAIGDELVGRATFSDDLRYRYMLSRFWGSDPAVTFIMLNPSTGDERNLEATTAGCASRARKWGYGGIVVANLFALISTDPKVLAKSADPIGPLNNAFIDNLQTLNVHTDGKIICAWGKHGRLNNREQEVLKLLKGVPLYALDLNKDGTPRHPLHMSHSKEPGIWFTHDQSLETVYG